MFTNIYSLFFFSKNETLCPILFAHENHSFTGQCMWALNASLLWNNRSFLPQPLNWDVVKRALVHPVISLVCKKWNEDIILYLWFFKSERRTFFLNNQFIIVNCFIYRWKNIGEKKLLKNAIISKYMPKFDPAISYGSHYTC